MRSMYLEMSGLLGLLGIKGKNTQFIVHIKNYSSYVSISSINECPLEDEDKNRMLSELCAMDIGNCSSKRLKIDAYFV